MLLMCFKLCFSSWEWKGGKCIMETAQESDKIAYFVTDTVSLVNCEHNIQCVICCDVGNGRVWDVFSILKK